VCDVCPATDHSCSALPGIRQFLYPVQEFPVDDSAALDPRADPLTTILTTTTVDIASDESAYGSACKSFRSPSGFGLMGPFKWPAVTYTAVKAGPQKE